MLENESLVARLQLRDKTNSELESELEAENLKVAKLEPLELETGRL